MAFLSLQSPVLTFGAGKMAGCEVCWLGRNMWVAGWAINWFDYSSLIHENHFFSHNFNVLYLCKQWTYNSVGVCNLRYTTLITSVLTIEMCRRRWGCCCVKWNAMSSIIETQLENRHLSVPLIVSAVYSVTLVYHYGCRFVITSIRLIILPDRLLTSSLWLHIYKLTKSSTK